MDSDNRVPPDATPPARRVSSPPFCRVERNQPDGSTRTFVVHTGAPSFLVEFEGAANASTGSDREGTRPTPVIRRVCVPNNWAGDYQRCARLLGAAAEFFTATERTAE